jgi:hypothetical protein
LFVFGILILILVPLAGLSAFVLNEGEQGIKFISDTLRSERVNEWLGVVAYGQVGMPPPLESVKQMPALPYGASVESGLHTKPGKRAVQSALQLHVWAQKPESARPDPGTARPQIPGIVVPPSQPHCGTVPSRQTLLQKAFPKSSASVH